jgi:hypothetical protein
VSIGRKGNYATSGLSSAISSNTIDCCETLLASEWIWNIKLGVFFETHSAIALIAVVDGVAFRRNLDLDRARMKRLYYVLKSTAPGSSFSFAIQSSSTDRRGQMDETTRKPARN